MGEKMIWTTTRLVTSILAALAALGYLVLAVRGLAGIPFDLAPEAAMAAGRSDAGAGGDLLAVPLVITAVFLSGLLLAAGGVAGLRSFQGQRAWRSGQRLTLAGGMLGVLAVGAGPAVTEAGDHTLSVAGLDNGALAVVITSLLIVTVLAVQLFCPKCKRRAETAETATQPPTTTPDKPLATTL